MFTNLPAIRTNFLSPTSLISPFLITESVDDLLADLLDLRLVEVGVALADDLRNQDLVHDLGVDVARHRLEHRLVLKDLGLQVVEIGLDDVLAPARSMAP